MPKFKKISIIIANFKSKRYLKKCIASVYSKVAPKITTEIIIINNDGEENLTEIKAEFPQLIIYDNFSNSGLSVAWNQGEKLSSGEIIWFLNPDTEIISENIENVISEFERDNNLAVVGSGLVDLENKKQSWSAGKNITLGDVILNNLGFIRSRKIWESSEKKYADWVSGASFFVKKNYFKEINGFDEGIFLYFEDADLCLRFRQIGKKVLYFPTFRVRHLCGGSHNDKIKQKSDFYKSQDYYFRKHLGIFQLTGLKIIRKLFVGK